jgi:carbon-monoxide dehydrogenase medium subunit
LWVGAISGKPTRLAQSEEAGSHLPQGLAADEVWQRLQSTVAAEAGQIEAHDDIHGGADYKRHLVTVLAQRAIQACLK